MKSPVKASISILLIPSVGRGNGTGHLRRCIELAVKFHNHPEIKCALYTGLPYLDHDQYSDQEIQKLITAKKAEPLEIIDSINPEDWDICIFDERETSAKKLHNFSGKTLSIGIDEGGNARDYFDYLIDILPNMEESEPNISSVGFLNLPEPANSSSERFFNLKADDRILISFGGEDREGLSLKMITMIDDAGIFKTEQLTVVKGPMFSGQSFPESVNVLDCPPDLRMLIPEYDLVVTSFGITCFEALNAGVPVVLFNPSHYHKMLSVRAGIPEIGVLNPDAKRLDHFLRTPQRLLKAVDAWSGKKQMDLAGYILNLEHSPRNRCRTCGNGYLKAVNRSVLKTYFKCPDCGIISLQNYDSKKTVYNSNYFFDEYRNQYGRTYLEDFENIKRSGIERCRYIRKLTIGDKLLDIGCGYGPFLSAALNEGFQPFGIDISDEAVEYINSELGFRAAAAEAGKFSPGELFGIDEFDAVTMWYVIEHIEQIPELLKHLYRIVKPGGVFAFSTPSYKGISARRSLGGFLNASPSDHLTVWSPQSSVRLLRKYGFRVRKIKIPAPHPERFFHNPNHYYKMIAPVKFIVTKILTAVSRCFLLGDTFEVYAVRIDSRKRKG